MNKLFCGVMALAGCVLVAGAGIAETAQAREDKKSRDAEAVREVRTPPGLSKQNKWSSMERHPNPHVGKEETKDLLRAKRPK